MVNMAPKFLVPLFEQLGCIDFLIADNLEHVWQCQVDMEQVRMMTIACMSTLSRKAMGRATVNTISTKDVAQATRATETSTRARIVVERTGHWVFFVRDQMEEHTTATITTTPPTTTKEATKEASANSWTWCRRVRFQKQRQHCRVFIDTEHD